MLRGGLVEAIPTGGALVVAAMRDRPGRRAIARTLELLLLGAAAHLAAQLDGLELLTTDGRRALELLLESLRLEWASILGVAAGLGLATRYAGQAVAGVALALPLGIGSSVLIFEAGLTPELLIPYMLGVALGVPCGERAFDRVVAR